jgi:hypothetical protein
MVSTNPSESLLLLPTTTSILANFSNLFRLLIYGLDPLKLRVTVGWLADVGFSIFVFLVHMGSFNIQTNKKNEFAHFR